MTTEPTPAPLGVTIACVHAGCREQRLHWHIAPLASGGPHGPSFSRYACGTHLGEAIPRDRKVVVEAVSLRPGAY